MNRKCLNTRIRVIYSLQYTTRRHIFSNTKRGSVYTICDQLQQKHISSPIICSLTQRSRSGNSHIGRVDGGRGDWGQGPQNTTWFFKSGAFMMMMIYALSFKNKADNNKKEMSDQEKLVVEADRLHNELKLEDVYKLLVVHKDCDNPEVLWRFARACREYSLLPSVSSKEKRSMTYEAVESAKKAISIDDQHPQCHKWYGISLVETGDYDGIKKKIADSYIVKEHFLKALELNPSDASPMHLMGRWCFSFADMPWYQQKIATAIFGKPPTSTFEEALEYFCRGEAADPGFYSVNQLYLGKTYIKLKDNQSAITWLTKLKDYPGSKEEDNKAKKEAIDLLKTLGVK